MRMKYGILVSVVMIAMLLCLAGCDRNESDIEKLGDYLYSMEMDEYTFEAVPEESPLYTFGCSSIRKGDLYGRNLDLGYCETPEFIIRMSAAEGRYASIGVCTDPSIICTPDEMTEEELLAMPQITNDGINENGVIISENIVDVTGVDDMKGTNPGKEKIHSSRVTRYILDRAESADHAVELLKDIDIVGGFAGYGIHWMIADENDTYVAEIIDGELIAEKKDKPCLTNFYVNYGPEQKEQTIAGNVFRDVPKLNDYAIGVERWCELRDAYDSISSAEDMAKLLESVAGTAMYDKDKKWYSECVGGEISIHSDRAAFEKELERQIECFETRDRKNPKGDWITWHTSIYNIKDKTLEIYSQEDYSKSFSVEAP